MTEAPRPRAARRGPIVFMAVWLTLWSAAILMVLWMLGGAALSGDLGAAPFLLLWLGFAGLGLYAGLRRLRALLGLAGPPAPPPPVPSRRSRWDDGLAPREAGAPPSPASPTPAASSAPDLSAPDMLAHASSAPGLTSPPPVSFGQGRRDDGITPGTERASATPASPKPAPEPASPPPASSGRGHGDDGLAPRTEGASTPSSPALTPPAPASPKPAPASHPPLPPEARDG